MKKILMILICGFALSACGYHLRAAENQPSQPPAMKMADCDCAKMMKNKQCPMKQAKNAVTTKDYSAPKSDYDFSRKSPVHKFNKNYQFN